MDRFVQKQLEQGYMLGPFTKQEGAGIITSSLVAIPKKTPGQWRIIVNLSSPANASVNDNLTREFTQVVCTSVEDAVFMIHHLGQSALLAKVDIQEAYRMVPVHPWD